MARTSDVQLVIRARNEAQRTLDQLNSAVQRLAGSQDGLTASADRTGAELQQLERGLSQLQKYNASIAASIESATGAMSRQAQALLGTNAQIQDRKNRVAELTRALDILKREADQAFVGPRRNGLDASIKSAQGQLKQANADVARLSGTFNRELAALQSSRQAFAAIKQTQREAESSIAGVTAEIAQQTQAIEANNAAARQAKAAQTFFNAKAAPGLGRNPLSAGDKEEIAAILRVAGARDIEIQKLRAEEQATAELMRTQEAQRRAATLGVSGQSGKSARDSAAVFQEADIAATKRFQDQMGMAAARSKEMQAAVAKLRAELNPLAAVEEKLVIEEAKLNALHKAGRISADELSGGLRLLRKRADEAKRALNGQNGLDSRGRPSLFGLKPYELQNLSFQINDVFTQLGSGAPLTQVIAQQGGQILQLFPKVGSAIAAGLTSAPVLIFTAALAGVVIGLKEAADQAEELRKFEAILTASADGAKVQAKALQGATRELDRYGLSAEEAVDAIKLFFREGIDSSRFVEFGETAKDLADAMGIDLVQATKEVAEGFSKGYDSVKKLDDAYDFLTAAQRANIRTLFEEGRAGEARNEALRIFSEQMGKAADKARGEWSEAFRSLGSAWDTFTNKLANSGPIQKLSKWLGDAAIGANLLTVELAGAGNASETLLLIARRVRDIGELEEQIRGSTDKFANDSRKRRIDVLQRQLVDLRQQLKEFQDKAENNGGDTLRADREGEKRADEDLRRADERRLASEQQVSQEKRLQIAYQDALLEAQEKGASAAAAREHALVAQAAERRKIEKEITAERERREREFAAQIADNGRDQLIQTAQRFTGFSENNPAQRGDLQDFFRQNGINVDPKMTAWCAAFVNAVLATNGLPGTGKLNARSFLGFGQDVTSNPEQGDIVVLKRGKNPAEGHVGFFQGFDERGNVRVLGGNQGDRVSTQTFDRKDVLGIRRAPSLGQVATEQLREDEQQAKALDAAIEKQDQFKAAIDRQIESRKADTEQLREQAGLTGEALLDAEKRAAIEDAVLKVRQDAAKVRDELVEKGASEQQLKDFDAGLEKQIADVRDAEAAWLDLAKARDLAQAQRVAAEQPVADLVAQRDEIQRQIEFFQQNGQAGIAAQLEPQLAAVNLQLDGALDKLRAFYDTIIAQGPVAAANLGLTVEQVKTLRLGLETLSSKAINLGTQFLQTGRQINESLAGNAASGFDYFAQRVAAGDNVLRSLRDAFLQFASDFLRQIAQMIIQQAIFNALGGANGSGNGGSGGFISALIGSLFHEGGVVGRDGQPRAALPGWWDNAARMHTGGIAGLRPNEIPAILQEGEEVLTRGDPRHVLNGGGGGDGAGGVKIVNAIDSGDFVSHGLSTKKGEKAVMNFIRANKGAVKRELS